MKRTCFGVIMALSCSLMIGCCGKAITTSVSRVRCLATLEKFDEEHAWSDHNVDTGWDDGIAPLATFKITPPNAYRCREIGILFKSTHLEDKLPIMKLSVGEDFLVDLPEDFLKGEAKIIDADHVYVLEKEGP